MSEKLPGTSTTKILILGWYHQHNLGDELFMEAFKCLFPTYQLTFTDHITLHDLEAADAVFIGGGSFLGEQPPVAVEAWELLKEKKLFYLGVGAETDIHPDHAQLMRRALLIAVRTPEYVEKVKEINSNVMVIPDLVNCLPEIKSETKIEKSILIMPNVLVVPHWGEPHWKHAAWTYFKSEFSQAIDALVKEKWTVHFLPMSDNKHFNDAHAAYELINATQNRDHFVVHDKPQDAASVLRTISQYQLVITQRYHGIVLSNMAGVSCVSIYHHDKLRDHTVSFPYYGLIKKKLLDQIDVMNSAKNPALLPIDRDIFVDLKRRVDDALCRS